MLGRFTIALEGTIVREEQCACSTVRLLLERAKEDREEYGSNAHYYR